jgi:hypothetical protein
MASEIEHHGVRPEGVARDQPRPQFRQRPFLFLREMGVEIFRHHQLQNGITQKFEPLIINVITLFLVPDTRVCQRLFQQTRVAKSVTEAQLERVHVSVSEKPPAT